MWWVWEEKTNYLGKELKETSEESQEKVECILCIQAILAFQHSRKKIPQNVVVRTVPFNVFGFHELTWMTFHSCLHVLIQSTGSSAVAGWAMMVPVTCWGL